MSDMHAIVEAIRSSENFKAEARYIGLGGYTVAETPRLFKYLEDDLVRVVFPTNCTEVCDGAIVTLTTLWDKKNRYNIYAHTICAGPGVNTLFRAIHAPMPSALPQHGKDGEKAILRFVAWKEAAWTRFLNDDLELGAEEASALWLDNFWKALDRLFGGGHLVDFEPGQLRAAVARNW
jgi:hypothetical protein